MKIINIPAIIVVLYGLCAVSLWAQPTNAPGTNTNAPTRKKAQVLSPNDLISVEVFKEAEDFNPAPRRIASDGTVSIALLDRISIAGKTVEQAEKFIREELIAKEYLVDPKVTVTVIEHFKWRFTVTGQVQATGIYEVSGEEKIDLIQALSRAGGVTSKGKSKVSVTRKVGDSTQIHELDAKDTKDQQFEIQPNDVITVPEKVF